MNRKLHYRFTSYFGIHDCCVAPDTGTNTIMKIWAALAVDLGVKLFVVAYSCRKPWLLWLAAAYTFNGATDQNIRRLTAYKLYSGLWRRLRGLGYRTQVCRIKGDKIIHIKRLIST